MVFSPGFEKTLAVNVQSEGADEFVGSLDDAIESLGGFKAAVGLAGGALAALSVGALAKATASAAEFEQAMVEVQKVTDEVTAATLSEDIRELASAIPIAQKELAGITADAARFGIRGTENINAFTESVARMSVATDLATDEAGEAFAKLATLTKTPISEMENLGSAINTLSNNFATSSQEIVDSMLRSSGAMSQLGVRTTDIVGISAALNEVSASSERAGTRLRRLAQILVEPKRQREIAEAMGLTAEGFSRMVDEDPTAVIREMAAAMAEGGEEADRLNEVLDTRVRAVLAGLGQNLEGLDAALGESSESFDEATSLQEEFEAATDTTSARARVLKNRLGNLAITTGEGLLPVVNDLIGGVSFLVGGFNDFNRALDGLPAQITAVTGAAAGLGLMLSSFGIAAGGPVALAVAGIGALAIAWSRDFADIRTTTKEGASEIVASFGRVIGALKGTESAIEDNAGLWDSFERGLAQFIDTVRVGLVAAIDAATTKAGNFILQMKSVLAAADALSRGDRELALDELAKGERQVAEREAELAERLEEQAVAADKRRDRRASGLPATPEDATTESEATGAEAGAAAGEAYAEAFAKAYEEATGQPPGSDVTGTGGGATGVPSGGDAVSLSAEDRAALVRQVGEQAVRARRADDATERPGRAGELAARLGRGGPSAERVVEMHNRVRVDATVEANSREEGEAAAAGLEDELRSANIVDTGTVTAR